MGLIDLTRSTRKGRKNDHTASVPASVEKAAEAPKAVDTPTVEPVVERESSPAPVTQPEAPSDDLRKLREIVFGPQLADFQESLTRVEADMLNEIRSLGAKLENRVSELDTRLTRADGELRDDLQERSDLLANAIQESNKLEEDHQLAVEALSDGLQELREHKIDRSALSTFLVDLASQIEADGSTR